MPSYLKAFFRFLFFKIRDIGNIFNMPFILLDYIYILMIYGIQTKTEIPEITKIIKIKVIY